MFGIGVPELIVILIIALLFIGPKRLPEVARSIGRGYREFQRALSGVKHEMDEMESAVKQEIRDVESKVKKEMDSSAPPAETSNDSKENGSK